MAGVRNKARRISSFETTFLRDALTGGDSNFDEQKGKIFVLIFNPIVTTGVFTRTGENTATFTAINGTASNISVNFDTQSATINNNAGVSNSVGLSGNNAILYLHLVCNESTRHQGNTRSLSEKYLPS
ncbi:MAG: hypothetical protein AB1861_27535 [Cyanobacteriota bacterium]